MLYITNVGQTELHVKSGISFPQDTPVPIEERNRIELSDDQTLTRVASGQWLVGNGSANYSPAEGWDIIKGSTPFPERTINETDRIKVSVAPDPHHATHENNGEDEINVNALSGLLADQQHIIPSEAVTAMGVKANSNPLNHDRFQQSEITALPESQLQLNYATHSNANDPTSVEKQALDAASSPGTTNPFLTKSAGDAAYATLSHNHPSTQITDFSEAAQDSVGNILTDTNSVDFTYDDANNQIRAAVRKQNSATVDMSEDGSGVKAELNTTLKSNYDTAYSHTSRTDNPHSTTKEQVSLGNVDNVQQMPLSYLDIDGTLAANSDAKVASQKAVKTYVDNSFAAQDAMIFKGVINCSASPDYPAGDKGHTYKISVAGKIGGASGPNVEVNDMVICTVDGSAAGTHAAVGANWDIIQANIDGAVIGPASSTDNAIARFDGTSGKLIQNSLVTINDSGSVNIPTGQTYNINGSAHGHTSAQVTDFNEAAQDAVGGILTDTNSIDFTYDDANNQIRAAVKKQNSASVDLTEDTNGVSATLNTALKSNYDSAYSHTSLTNNPHNTTKSQVGLGNADNTSDADKPVSTATQSALNLKLNTALKGVANGLAELDGTGKVPTAQLPSFVDDVLEYANLAAFPSTGEAGKIYVALDTNLTYRWSGSAYVNISPSLALGETSSTAYRGDRGKTAYDHSQITGNPHGTTKTDIGLGYVTNDAQLKIASNLADLNNVTTARSNLGLGDSATKNVGTATGTVAAGDHLHTGVYEPANANIQSHISSTSNPHVTTKEQVGLGNCDNTSDLNKPVSTAQQTALNLKLNTSLKGAVNGLAELGSDGKVPSAQLPSFVDDVLEYANLAAFPGTGEAGKIYVALDTGKIYRWSGTTYTEISASLALGETSTTAYRGDRGKTAYDHSQIISGNPHNTAKADVGLGNVTNDAQLKVASNLSDLNNVVTARTNLGLGTAATKNVGTGASDVAAGVHGHVWTDVSKAGSKLTDIADVSAYPNNSVKNVLRELNGATAWESITSLVSNASLAACQVTRTTDQTFTTSYTDITFNSIDYQNAPDVIARDNTYTQRIYFKAAGQYQIAFQFTVDGDTTALSYARIYKNGTTMVPGSESYVSVGVDKITSIVLGDFAANDYITLQIMRSGGSSSVAVAAIVLYVIALKGTKGDKGDAGGTTVDVLQDGTTVKADVDELNFIGATVASGASNRVDITIPARKRTSTLTFSYTGNFTAQFLAWIPTALLTSSSGYIPSYPVKIREISITSANNGSSGQTNRLRCFSRTRADGTTINTSDTLVFTAQNTDAGNAYNDLNGRHWKKDVTASNITFSDANKYGFYYDRVSGTSNLNNVVVQLELEEV